MLYQWKCQKCGNEVEVSRKIDDRDKGPEERCRCGECDFVRVITGGTGFVLLGGGWFNKGGY